MPADRVTEAAPAPPGPASVSPAAQRADEMLRFIDAVSPFISDVLDEPFPWKHGGQVVVNLTRYEYEEAVAALEALRD